MLVENLISLVGTHIPFGTVVTTIDVFDNFVNVVVDNDGVQTVRSFVFDGIEFVEDKETVWTIQEE